MIALIRFLLAMLTSPFKSKSRLEAENAALRQQLIVLRRKVRGRARLTNRRWFFVQLTDGSHRSSRPSRLFVPRPCCVGIGPAFVVIGVGNHGVKEGDRRFRHSCVRSYDK